MRHLDKRLNKEIGNRISIYHQISDNIREKRVRIRDSQILVVKEVQKLMDNTGRNIWKENRELIEVNFKFNIK